jgi:hypothetical protein
MKKRLFLCTMLIATMITSSFAGGGAAAFADDDSPEVISVNQTAWNINSFSGDVNLVTDVLNEDSYDRPILRLDRYLNGRWDEDEEMRTKQTAGAYDFKIISPFRKSIFGTPYNGGPWEAGTYTYRLRLGNDIENPEAVSENIIINVMRANVKLYAGIVSQKYSESVSNDYSAFSGEYKINIIVPGGYNGEDYDFPDTETRVNVQAYTGAKRIVAYDIYNVSYVTRTLDLFPYFDGNGISFDIGNYVFSEIFNKRFGARPEKIVFTLKQNNFLNATTVTLQTGLKAKAVSVKAKNSKSAKTVSVYANHQGKITVYKGKTKVGSLTIGEYATATYRSIKIKKLKKGTHKLTFKFVPTYKDLYKSKTVTKKIKIK